MSLTSDDHHVEIAGHTVAVTGRTGPVHATWTLLIDDRETDSAKAAGDFTLRGELPDGSEIRASVHQSLVGPTEVVIYHGGEQAARFTGFVA
ncbi:hypothetical protein ACFFMN_33095 [Planobispora siamensis]|uniref:Uncharacterized protein n=1 Tax=Planobispora siamensis TaxID=936338 RepID=A0A8J3WLJ1_9ACTN|nr:hypothetical protein [Planobispora siamensis]GIH92597.1 hypothetical protein Psi01_32270 [Planobispora siamensis]